MVLCVYSTIIYRCVYHLVSRQSVVDSVEAATSSGHLAESIKPLQSGDSERVIGP